jgi:hypothetical protein
MGSRCFHFASLFCFNNTNHQISHRPIEACLLKVRYFPLF